MIEGRFSSPIGDLWVTVNAAGAITELRITDTATTDAPATLPDDSPALLPAFQWLTDYFAGRQPSVPDCLLAPSGTVYQCAVWQLLRTIPYGTTVTYGALARELMHLQGKQTCSAQAIGGAVGRNPIPILIPCHRVIGANGTLTGYHCGLARKVFLLQHEGVDCHLPPPPPSTNLSLEERMFK